MFASSTFIASYTPTDKSITFVNTLSKKVAGINVCRFQKASTEGSEVWVYASDGLVKLEFTNEADAKAGLVALKTAVGELISNCELPTTSLETNAPVGELISFQATDANIRLGTKKSLELDREASIELDTTDNSVNLKSVRPTTTESTQFTLTESSIEGGAQGSQGSVAWSLEQTRLEGSVDNGTVKGLEKIEIVGATIVGSSIYSKDNVTIAESTIELDGANDTLTQRDAVEYFGAKTVAKTKVYRIAGPQEGDLEETEVYNDGVSDIITKSLEVDTTAGTIVQRDAYVAATATYTKSRTADTSGITGAIETTDIVDNSNIDIYSRKTQEIGLIEDQVSGASILGSSRLSVDYGKKSRLESVVTPENFTEATQNETQEVLEIWNSTNLVDPIISRTADIDKGIEEIVKAANSTLTSSLDRINEVSLETVIDSTDAAIYGSRQLGRLAAEDTISSNDFTTVKRLEATLTREVISDTTDPVNIYSKRQATVKTLGDLVSINTAESAGRTIDLTTPGLGVVQEYYNDSNLERENTINDIEILSKVTDATDGNIYGVRYTREQEVIDKVRNAAGLETAFTLQDGVAIISSTVSTFTGLEYDLDYSANYTPRSLVDKAYVDANAFSPSYYFETVLDAIIQTTGSVNITGDTSVNLITNGGSISNSTNGGSFIVSAPGNAIQFDSQGFTFNGNSVLTSPYMSSLNYYVEGAGYAQLSADNYVNIVGQQQQVQITSWNSFIGLTAGTNVLLEAQNGSIVLTSYIGGIALASEANITLSTTQAGGAIYVYGQLVDFAGIQYDQDYSANYTTRSLVDKEYVDTAISTAVSNISINQIYDNSSNLSIDGHNRRLYTTGGSIVLDWEAGTMGDGAGTGSIDWYTRQLIDSTGNYAGNWSNRRLIDSTGNIVAVNWNNRQLHDASGNAVLDWTVGSASDNGGATLNWMDRLLYDGTYTQSLDWNNRTLKSGADIALNWSTRQMTDSNGLISINWESRQLFATGAGLVLDWSDGANVTLATPSSGGVLNISADANIIMTSGGDITLNTLVVNNELVTTGIKVLKTNNVAAGWHIITPLAVAAEHYLNLPTGNGASGQILINTFSGPNTNDLSWSSELRDTTNTASVVWNNRHLRNAGGNTVLAWDTTVLMDTSANIVMNWGSRELIASDGVTTVLDFSTQALSLTAASVLTVNSGDVDTDTVINNLRTRVNELESRLQAYGLLA